MPVINFDEFQDKIKERTKGMRPPKMPDRDVRDRNPYESDALARKVRESWLSNFDKGIMKKIPGGYEIAWEKIISQGEKR